MARRDQGVRSPGPGLRALASGFLLAAGLSACSGTGASAPSIPRGAMNEPAADFLQELLAADERLAPFINDAREYRLQVLLGLVEEDESGMPHLVQHAFRQDAEYFYPASTVKLFAAVAALETLNDLRAATGLDLGPDTALVYHPLFADEVLEDEDPSNVEGGHISIGQEIRKLFLVSDNVAFNRLYELVGPDGIHRSARHAGLDSLRVVHRLSEARSPEENLRLPRIEMGGEGLRHELPERRAESLPRASSLPGLRIGRGYLAGGERVNGPMDFQAKNRVSLADLQRGLAKVVRPDIYVGGGSFRLGEAQRERLRDSLSRYPGDSENPVYGRAEYPDHWAKFLLPGLRRAFPAEQLRVYNKIGRAYGFSIENAYVEDAATGRGFFLAAVVYTNRDGILNDDQYEYEEVADPFFADLGEVVARALWR